MSRLYARLIAREESAVPVSQWRTCVLHRHEASDYGGALVVASEMMQALEVSARSRTGAKVLFPATPGKISVKFTGLTISVCISLCDTLGLAKDVKECEIRKLSESSSFFIDSLEISILEGFVSKRDIWKFQLESLGSAVYLGHAPSGAAGRWQVTDIRVQATSGAAGGDSPAKVPWGVIGSKTQVVFNSLSAQLVIFLVLTKETWDFDETDGLPYFEKFLDFLSTSEADSGHFVTIVLTIRLSLRKPPAGFLNTSEDYYEIVYQGNRASLNKSELFAHLRQFFFSFPGTIGWQPEGLPSYALRATGRGDFRDGPYSLLADSKVCKLRMQHLYAGDFPTEAVPVTADRCNVLEAMNLGFDQFALVHVDRKLQSTNFRVAVVYAGNGSLVDVDAKLCEVTRARVAYHRPVSVLVCLKSPPLFRVPRVEVNQGGDLEPVDAAFLNLVFFGSQAVRDSEARGEREGSPSILMNASSRFKVNPTPAMPTSEIDSTDVLAKIPLQRVATRSLPGGGGVAQVDTWVVQGDSGQYRKFHELVGMRMAFDMQLIDDTENTNFGTTVSRAALRGKDITEVQMRGMNTLWSLRTMEGGNISVSKTTFMRRYIFFEYQYMIRFKPYYKGEDMRNELLTRSELAPVMTKCKYCENIDFTGFSRRRKSLHSPLSILWNQLDHILTDTGTVVSSVLPLGAPRGELQLNYRTRPAIKTNFFCLLPEGLDHRDVLVRTGAVGLDPFAGTQTSGPQLFEKFLAFLIKFEQLTQIKLNVNLNRKSQHFTAMKVLVDEGKDWVTIHYDDGFVPPRIFVFSVEWLMCHAKFVQELHDAFAQAASCAGFSLIQLPHAQLFPASGPSALWADREVAFDRLPLRPRFVFVYPDWVSKAPGNFFSRFLNRLTECMKMLFLFHCVTPANLETEEEKTGMKRSIYLRYPSWTLMTREGCFFAIVRGDKCEVFDNYTFTWAGKRQLPALSAVQADYFTELRSFLHNTLVECEPSF